jgi:hypothetical protein
MGARTAGLAAALACWALACAGANAQASLDQARTYLDEGRAAHAELGYRTDRSNRDSFFTLRLSQARIIPVTLRAGRNYRVYAACDSDCSDMDLEIYDPNGERVDRDIADDDTPYVQLRPEQSGRYVVRAWLARCEQEPCGVGVRVLTGGALADRPEPAPAEDAGGSFAAHVTSILDQAGAGFAGEGFAPMEGDTGAIEPLETGTDGMTRTYTLRAAVTYRFVAACDQDCEDLDIAVNEEGGAELGVNADIDNPTVLDVTPGRSGPHSVRVWLAQCSNEPCYTGVRAFERLP